ncbi:MAG: glycosyltransferase [Actinomycetota bacterium]|nr:glycosyltransferase [Actinomycetota bacterium]
MVYEQSPKSVVKKFLLKLIGYIPQFVISYPRNLDFLDSYQGIIAISRYSQKWISRLWKRKSLLLFPPVEVEQFKPGPKQDLILSVGRFFPEHHNKKQLEMVQAFRQLCDEYPQQMEGYRLYLAGGLSEKKEHQDYVRRIEQEAEGYPVTVMANAEYGRLVELFSTARFFWHAAGMGESEARHPEKFEHFGITTVEAMAAGCIPIVINRGGQKEIIRDGIDGYLFDSISQLKSITIKAVTGQFDLESMALKARERARMFSSENFGNQLLSLVDKYLNHGSKHNNRKL